jgi:MerR family Zn(II)-responsive transcriptional regulator of zntA
MDLTEIKYTIGKVAARLAVSTDTLRHYEKNGLITPTSKTAAGYRLYN